MRLLPTAGSLLVCCGATFLVNIRVWGIPVSNGYRLELSNTFLTHALRNWGQLLQNRQIFRQGGGHPLVRCRCGVDVGVGGKIVVAVPQPGLDVLQRVA